MKAWKMDPLKIKERPEAQIQKDFEAFLVKAGWFVKRTHGNAIQSGWPDTYATHKQYGARWIEFKLPGMKGSRFTGAQLETFPKFTQHGAGIWVITGLKDYPLLFNQPNWHLML